MYAIHCRVVIMHDSKLNTHSEMSDELIIRAGQHSICGNKANNEDSCGIRIPQNYLLQTKGAAAIIADGVSSASNGREASESCVKGFLQDYYSTPESWSTQTSVQKVLGALNRWLYGMTVRLQGQVELGYVTTLSSLIIKSSSAYIFHIGDTRVYRWRDNQLEQLTRDHRIIAGGGKSFLSHAMGVDMNIEIDFCKHGVEQGDTFVLATDGVYEFVSHGEMYELLSTRAEPGNIAKSVCQRALDNQSDDNLTCQVIVVDAIPFYADENAFYRQLTELPFPPPLSAGMSLDGFKIVRELHESKRTQVYLANDIESGEPVAIKTPSVNYSDDADYIDSFLNEEWIGRRINNNHVLKVLPQPRKRKFLYYLTEYCEGQTLRQWMIDNKSPSLTQVREILNQLMHGVLAFHRLEMVHRDIKPENIVIDKNNTVKIIDFGSTRVAGIDEINKPVSVHGAVVGTINYSPPELLEGSAGTLQSDYYSIGVIVYEMLTGQLPYGDELNHKQLMRAEYRSASRIRKEIPEWVDGALRKCVHKSPFKRYQVLSEFIYDLSNPNKEFIKAAHQPLLDRNPLAFWKWLAAGSVILNLLFIYWLVNI